MKKDYFYNDKSINENKDNKRALPVSTVTKKSIVDINILLNRVKTLKQNEKKKKAFFLGSAVFTLSSMTLFLYFLK